MGIINLIRSRVKRRREEQAARRLATAEARGEQWRREREAERLLIPTIYRRGGKPPVLEEYDPGDIHGCSNAQECVQRTGAYSEP